MNPHETEQEALEWRVWLARRQPGRAAAAAAAILASGLLAFTLFHSLVFAVAASGLLLAALGEFMFPIFFRLSACGAEARNPFYQRRVAWREVKQVYADEQEIKLSPLARGGPREAFRGVLLRCEGNRDEVLEAVQRFREAAAPTDEVDRTDGADRH